MEANFEEKASRFNWNIVTRGLHGHPFLRERIHKKIRSLDRHLQRFPADAVHLLIELERHPRKEEHRAVLTLRLPSHILHAEKTAKSVIAALSNAARALLDELKSLKARLREEPQWKRKAKRRQLTFAAMPTEGKAVPQSSADVRDAFFKSHRRQLARFAERTAGRLRASGQPVASREIEDLLEEARDKFAAISRRQKLKGERAQLYRLVRDAVNRRDGNVRMTRPSTSLSEEPPVQSALLHAMDRTLAELPSFERDVFDLNYLEGFEAEEIAMITGKPLHRVREAIDAVENRIRQSLKREMTSEQR